MVQIFEAICLASPKTVKSTADILELWFFELKNVLHNERFTLNSSPLFDLIHQFIDVSGNYFDPVVIETLRNTLKI